MQPGVRNIKLYKGATDKITFWLKDKNQQPIDLTGATVTACLKDATNKTNCTEDDVIITAEEGKVVVVFTPEFKAPFSGKKGSWSVKIQWSNDEIWRILEGVAEYVEER